MRHLLLAAVAALALTGAHANAAEITLIFAITKCRC
jgi:hypothetical protein